MTANDAGVYIRSDTSQGVPDPEADSANIIEAIDNSAALNVLRSIKEGAAKKYAVKISAHLFRFLGHLSQIDARSVRHDALDASLLLINSLRSEADSVISCIERSADKVRDENFSPVLSSILFQFSMETKRVFLQELKDISRDGSRDLALKKLRGRLENSHGIMKNLSEQCIVQVLQFFNPELKGPDIFPDFVTRREQSLELREDVMLLNRFLALAGSTQAHAERQHVWASLRTFILYFESATSKLIRYNDYDEFSAYLNRVLTITKKDEAAGVNEKIMEEIRHFSIFIETYLKQLSQRAELAYMAVDLKKLENRMKQYLK